MTKQLDLKALVAAGIAFPVSGASRVDLLHAIANAYDGKAGEMLSLRPVYVNMMNIETTDLNRIRTVSTIGTAFEPAVDILQGAGVAVEPTMGSMMDTLSLDTEDMHELICYCDHATRSGSVMAQRFRNVAARGTAAAA